MRVFRMNDCDWVCAENEDQAKEYYRKETEFSKEEIEDEFLGEVGLDSRMLVSVNDLPEEERLITQMNMQYFGGDLCVHKSFHWVIQKENITEPCIITSTEH